MAGGLLMVTDWLAKYSEDLQGNQQKIDLFSNLIIS